MSLTRISPCLSLGVVKYISHTRRTPDHLPWSQCHPVSPQGVRGAHLSETTCSPVPYLPANRESRGREYFLPFHLRLWGGTSKSRVFWGRLAHTEEISFLSSASHWCCFVPAGSVQRGRKDRC
jgi:hypothetical protein